MSKNKDTMIADAIAKKIAFTPMTAINLFDELADLAKEYQNDYQLGLMIRAVYVV